MKVEIDGSEMISENGNVSLSSDKMKVTSEVEISKSWEQQLERTKRNYERAKSSCTEYINSTGDGNWNVDDECLDQIYNLFMNCYHIKDWLINDQEFPADSKQVEEYINEKRELKLCADLCNGHKHFVLSKPRSHEYPNVHKETSTVQLKASSIEKNTGYIVATNSGHEDALALAHKCLILWEQYIKSKVD